MTTPQERRCLRCDVPLSFPSTDLCYGCAQDALAEEQGERREIPDEDYCGRCGYYFESCECAQSQP